MGLLDDLEHGVKEAAVQGGQLELQRLPLDYAHMFMQPKSRYTK